MSETIETDELSVFATSLGWMGIVASGGLLRELTLGHQTADRALLALDRTLTPHTPTHDRMRSLVERLQAYADGAKVDFDDVRIDDGTLTDFRRRVLRRCRGIRYGDTLTYGQLAAAAGRPRAARAVGACMASNRFPLVVPCHRVVAAGGRLAGFSAPGGVDLKRRLLDLESGKRAAGFIPALSVRRGKPGGSLNPAAR